MKPLNCSYTLLLAKKSEKSDPNPYVNIENYISKELD